MIICGLFERRFSNFSRSPGVCPQYAMSFINNNLIKNALAARLRFLSFIRLFFMAQTTLCNQPHFIVKLRVEFAKDCLSSFYGIFLSELLVIHCHLFFFAKFTTVCIYYSQSLYMTNSQHADSFDFLCTTESSHLCVSQLPLLNKFLRLRQRSVFQISILSGRVFKLL